MRIYKGCYLKSSSSNCKGILIIFFIDCSLIDEEQPELTSRAAFGWKQYHTIDEIYSWLDQMSRRYSREITNYNIGKTYEKRTIRAIKISHRPERVCLENTIFLHLK